MELSSEARELAKKYSSYIKYDNDFETFFQKIPEEYRAQIAEAMYVNGGVNFLPYMKTIPDKLFYHSDGITSVNIPDNITSIGDYAFADCPALKEVIISDTVNKLGKNVFYNCATLSQVKVGNGIVTIPPNTFTNDRELKLVELAESVKMIGKDAFENCDNVTIVTPYREETVNKVKFKEPNREFLKAHLKFKH